MAVQIPPPLDLAVVDHDLRRAPRGGRWGVERALEVPRGPGRIGEALYFVPVMPERYVDRGITERNRFSATQTRAVQQRGATVLLASERGIPVVDVLGSTHAIHVCRAGEVECDQGLEGGADSLEASLHRRVGGSLFGSSAAAARQDHHQRGGPDSQGSAHGHYPAATGSLWLSRLSTKWVSMSPCWKRASARARRWKGSVVLIPSTIISSTAISMRRRASGRSFP